MISPRLVDAQTFVRYRATRSAYLRRKDRADRSIFTKGLREAERRPFPEMRIFYTPNPFRPEKVAFRPRYRNPHYGEIVISTNMGPPGDCRVDFRHVKTWETSFAKSFRAGRISSRPIHLSLCRIYLKIPGQRFPHLIPKRFRNGRLVPINLLELLAR